MSKQNHIDVITYDEAGKAAVAKVAQAHGAQLTATGDNTARIEGAPNLTDLAEELHTIGNIQIQPPTAVHQEVVKRLAAKAPKPKGSEKK